MNQDLSVVEAVQQRLGLGLLETLIYIEQNTPEFTIRELRSYYRVMAQFRAMFSAA